MGRIIPYIMENKTYLKPPTRSSIIRLHRKTARELQQPHWHDPGGLSGRLFWRICTAWSSDHCSAMEKHFAVPMDGNLWLWSQVKLLPLIIPDSPWPSGHACGRSHQCVRLANHWWAQDDVLERGPCCPHQQRLWSTKKRQWSGWTPLKHSLSFTDLN